MKTSQEYNSFINNIHQQEWVCPFGYEEPRGAVVLQMCKDGVIIGPSAEFKNHTNVFLSKDELSNCIAYQAENEMRISQKTI